MLSGREYQINCEKTINSNNDDFQFQLSIAYKNKHRPQCLCRMPPVDMYLCRQNDHYLVKRMPGTGGLHDPTCPSFEIPPEFSGKSDLENSAITHEGSSTKLRVDFSLSQSSTTRRTSTEPGATPKEVKAQPKSLSLLSTLHYLYESAEFNKWTPAMKGKRNWPVIQKYLEIASQQISLKGSKLSDILMLPKPFSRDTIDQNKAARAKFFSQFAHQKGAKQKLGMLIGELKEIEPSKHGAKITIKHMPEKALFADEKLANRINKVFEKELGYLYEDDSCHVLAICTYKLSYSGFLQVDTFSLLLLDENWLPIENFHERELIESMLRQERSFVVNMRYNQTEDKIMASVILTDSVIPTAIFTTPVEATENYNQLVDEINETSDYDCLVYDACSESALVLPNKR